MGEGGRRGRGREKGEGEEQGGRRGRGRRRGRGGGHWYFSPPPLPMLIVHWNSGYPPPIGSECA